MISEQDISRAVGATAIDNDGDKIGDVTEIYLDDSTNRPEWATVKTGLFGSKETFVPLEGASLDGDSLRVPFDKSTIKDAPKVDADAHLSPEEEQELYRHYGLTDNRSAGVAGDVTTGRTTDGRDTTGRDTTGRDTQDADGSMTRSEEQLRVGTEQVEAGRARLRKHVVTENVTRTVPVSHEEVRVEREPITDADRGRSDAQVGEDEQEVTLHAERAVVDKETVPVERVSLGTETVTEQQQVTEQVSKEEIETDGVDNTGTNRR